jgi:hypothetical protein
MNTPVGMLVYYCGSLIHGHATIVENLSNGRLSLTMVGSQQGLTDVGRSSIREATNPLVVSIVDTINEISELIEDIEFDKEAMLRRDRLARIEAVRGYLEDAAYQAAFKGEGVEI